MQTDVASSTITAYSLETVDSVKKRGRHDYLLMNQDSCFNCKSLGRKIDMAELSIVFSEIPYFIDCAESS
jgi:hypothetical protein